MRVYAAVDVRGGRAVQLVGGDPSEERISRPDPVSVAREWVAAGMPALHVVDLDAALGDGNESAGNFDVIARIIAETDVPVQVGGGVRDEARAADLLEAGAAAVVVGTRAIEDAGWRRRLAGRFPGRIVVAADVRDGTVLSRGWRHDTGLPAEALLAETATEPLAGVLVTDVSREGRMAGVAEETFAALVTASAHPVIAAGGIRDIEDLRRLARVGAAGAVLGMSLYTGRIAPADVTRELGP